MYNRLYLISVLLCLAAWLPFAACEKPDTEPPTYKIAEEYYPYISFKPGSYWIYEDSVSGAVDSVVVTDYVLGTFGDSYTSKGIDYFIEYITVTWHSHFSSLDGQYVTTASCIPGSVENLCYFTTKGLSSVGGESGVAALGRYPFKTGHLSSQGAYSTHIYDFYTLDSATYQNVVRTRIPDDYTAGGDTSYYYFGKDAGLIRWEDKAPSGNWRIWKLKRYHAVR